VFNREFARFAATGVLLNGVMYLLFLLLAGYLMGPKAAMTISAVCGIALGYIVQRRWTFRTDTSVKRSLLPYLSTHAVVYVTNWSLLWFFVDNLKMHHAVVQVAAIFVCALLSYFLQRLWVFRER
jgi:putative flippase GtrA